MSEEEKSRLIVSSNKTKDMSGPELYSLMVDEEKFNEIFEEYLAKKGD